MKIKYTVNGETKTYTKKPPFPDKTSACLGILWNEGYYPHQLDPYWEQLEKYGETIIGRKQYKLVSFELDEREKKGLFGDFTITRSGDRGNEYTSQLSRKKEEHNILYT